MLRAALRNLLAAEPPHAGRREFKYMLAQLRGHDATAMVRSRVPALRCDHPPREVSSLYFDSAHFICYSQSNAGESERVKLRLRWYGTLHADTTPTLELKYRASHLGWKSLYPMEGLSLPSALLRDLPRVFAATVAPAERPVVELLRLPIVITTYLRHYLATADGGIRVTVDTGLRFHDQRLGSTLRTTFDGSTCDFAVVECKMDPAREAEAARMLRALAPRHTRFSKYCHAVGRVARL